MFKKKYKASRVLRKEGQVMLLAVFLIGAVVLVFSSVAWYFMVQRIRMSSNISDTTKAILAADSGLDCEAYNFLKSANISCNDLIFDNGASVSTTVFSLSGTDVFIKSVGSLKSIKRAFLMKAR